MTDNLYTSAFNQIGKNPVDQAALSMLRRVPSTLEPYVIVAMHELGAPVAADIYCKLAQQLTELSAVHTYLWGIDQTAPAGEGEWAFLGNTESDAAKAAREKMEAARTEIETFAALCREIYEQHVDGVYAAQQTFP